MKKYFLLFILCMQLSSFSQSPASREQVEKEIRKLFSAISPSKFAELVPFTMNKKWGYIDKGTKKILVPALFEEPRFFNPDLFLWYKGVAIKIHSNGEIEILDPETVEDNRVVGYDAPDTINSEGNGFTVNKDGKLRTYAKRFLCNRNGYMIFDLRPFKFKDQYYAIARDCSGMLGIIDTSGTELNGFGFKYADIILHRKTADTNDLWFYVKATPTGNYSLRSFNGNEKFKEEFYSTPATDIFLFGIQTCIKYHTCGSFDAYNLEWIIRPQSVLMFDNPEFSSRRKLDWNDPAHRKEANIYYLVNEGNKTYYMDLKGIKYLPVK